MKSLLILIVTIFTKKLQPVEFVDLNLFRLLHMRCSHIMPVNGVAVVYFCSFYKTALL